jgi:hypothetical protein
MSKLKLLLISLFIFNHIGYNQVANTLLRPVNEIIINKDSVQLMASCMTDYLKGLKFSFNSVCLQIKLDKINL